MDPINCAYCKRLKRLDQLMETQTHKLICIDCSEEFQMCEVCGSTTRENYSPHGQLHYEQDCLK